MDSLLTRLPSLAARLLAAYYLFETARRWCEEIALVVPILEKSPYWYGAYLTCVLHLCLHCGSDWPVA